MTLEDFKGVATHPIYVTTSGYFSSEEIWFVGYQTPRDAGPDMLDFPENPPPTQSPDPMIGLRIHSYY